MMFLTISINLFPSIMCKSYHFPFFQWNLLLFDDYFEYILVVFSLYPTYSLGASPAPYLQISNTYSTFLSVSLRNSSFTVTYRHAPDICFNESFLGFNFLNVKSLDFFHDDRRWILNLLMTIVCQQTVILFIFYIIVIHNSTMVLRELLLSINNLHY